MQQFSGIRLLKKWNYNTIFNTREQNLPLVAKNSKCANLKTTLGIQKFFLFNNFFSTTSAKKQKNYIKTWLQHI